MDFLQWTGSQAQKDALQRLHHFSADLHATEAKGKTAKFGKAAFHSALEQARWRLLRAETSCNLFWGEAWVHRIHEDLDAATPHLEKAKQAATGPEAGVQPLVSSGPPTG